MDTVTIGFDATVARLAVEGVPVCAIARATQHATEDVSTSLKQALSAGLIVELPKPDWNPKDPVSGRSPAFKASIVSDEQYLSSIVRTFGLTKLQARMFAVLLRRNEATKDMLHAVVEANREAQNKEETEKKIVDVVICNLRKRLTPQGILVTTIWSCGYCLTPEMRTKANAMLAAGGVFGSPHKEGDGGTVLVEAAA